MSLEAIIQQGRFTADGNAKTLQIRSDVDYMKVINYTQWATQQATGRGVAFEWYRGLSAGYGFETKKTNSTDALNGVLITSGGFTLVDSSVQSTGTVNATVTAISNAAIPVVSNSGTNGLLAGDVVRIINVSGSDQLGGFDFTVGNNTLTSGTFSLDYKSQVTAGTTGSWVKIPFDPIYYPRRRYISKITQASQAVVTLTVTHGYFIGQVVKLRVPDVFGMVEMNDLYATIVNINTTAASGNTVTLNVDSSAFTAFAWPAAGATPFDAAEMIPVGEDTAYALSNTSSSPNAQNILSDATINTAYIGMILAGGAQSPAGSASDVIYWQACKVFSVDNQ